MSLPKEYVIHKLVTGGYSVGTDFTQPLNQSITIDTDDVKALSIGGSGGEVFTVDTVNQTIQYQDGNQQAGYVLTSDANGIASWVANPVGESNTVSNQGAGQGLFKQKTGPDLEFYSVEGGVGLTDVLATDVITFNLDNTTVTPATYGDSNSVGQFTVDPQGRITSASNVDISHDALTDYVANQHIDWTNATDTFLTNVGNNNTFVIQDGLGVDVFNVNSNNGLTRVDGRVLIEGDAGSALLVRKDNAVKDIFNVNTNTEFITSNARVRIDADSNNTLQVRTAAGVEQFRVNTNLPRVDISAPIRYTGSAPSAGFLLESDAQGDLSYVSGAPLVAYGGLSVSGNVVATSLPLVNTYYKYTNWSTVLPQKGVTGDATTNDEIVVDTAGDYIVNYYVSSQNTSANIGDAIQVELFVNGTGNVNTRSVIDYTTATERKIISGGGVITIAASATLDLRINNITAAGTSITGIEAQLVIQKVG
jgi:hypothetical protein